MLFPNSPLRCSRTQLLPVKPVSRIDPKLLFTGFGPLQVVNICGASHGSRDEELFEPEPI